MSLTYKIHWKSLSTCILQPVELQSSWLLLWQTCSLLSCLQTAHYMFMCMGPIIAICTAAGPIANCTVPGLVGPISFSLSGIL